MNQGVCHLSQIPLRGEPRSSAEMVSQLLYGETYKIINQVDGWSQIQMDYDGYLGWLSDSSIFPWDGVERPYTLFTNNEIIRNHFNGLPLITSMGFQVEPKITNTHRVVELANRFLGSPYMWGGRHCSGIDCSGLMQVVYKVIGVKLPRDASQQQKAGKPVSFDRLFEGDLVFFEKNEKITHVGMVIGENKIIHAHGFVRIDELTKDGIVNSDTGILTHHYHSAKRIR